MAAKASKPCAGELSLTTHGEEQRGAARIKTRQGRVLIEVDLGFLALGLERSGRQITMSRGSRGRPRERVFSDG